ncbi:unnamed protein product [Candidula unifasciata]|uniref:Transmembrane protein 135 N-terminal domain-containing protein n=1 Tax=Candidula unifasciata TaxID=100452 RepID=A0A8S3YQ36_9EUPU|nr:unnamed protein product [Candidula unifasciata]
MKIDICHHGVDNQKDGTREVLPSSDKSSENNHPHSETATFNRKLCFKIFRNFVLRFLRGFANGTLLHLGVKIVAALLRNPVRKKNIKIWQCIFTKDTVRIALFCALYPSIYHLLVEILSALQKQQNGWIFGISGGLAGLSLAVLKTSTRQTLAFFTLSRALGSGISTLVRKGILPAVPFFEVGVFCACGSLLAYCVSSAPSYMNQSYYRTLLKWMRDYSPEKFHRLFVEPGDRFLTCQETGVHEPTCLYHAVLAYLYSLPGLAKIYLPVYLIPVFLFKRATVMDKPMHFLQSLSKNTAMSTVFLASMISLAKGTICLLRNISHRPPPCPAYVPLTAGAVSGLALLLERPSRRKELVLFAIPQVVYVIDNFMKGSKLCSIPKFPRGFTLLFALSMACVMYSFEREPQSLTTLIRGVLKYFIGPRSRSSLDVSPTVCSHDVT